MLLNTLSCRCLPPLLVLVATQLFAESVSLSWTANSETDLAGYHVYRTFTPGTGYVRLNATPVVSPSFQDPTVLAGNSYYYAVTAMNTSGMESNKSSDVLAFIPLPEVNQPPSAYAGPDQSVSPGAVVTLMSSCTDPDGDMLSYNWSQIGGPNVALAGVDSPNASFTAPSFTVTTTVCFRLSVSDGKGGTASDDVNVVIIVNQPPSAYAGPDQTVSPGDVVTLISSCMDPDGDALTYSWSQISGPPVALAGADSPTAGFTAPTVTATTTVSLRLSVSDGRGGAANDDVCVVIAVNEAPTANAGPDQRVSPGDVVTLISSCTDPDGDALTYSWSQVSGPTVAFAGVDSPTASFTAPAVTETTTLSFRLSVSDEKGGTASDDVNVVVAVNEAPTANAGPDQNVKSGVTVTLDGSGSDPDGDQISFSWRQASGPTVVLADADTAVATFTAPAVSKSTTFVFVLTVKDDKGAEASDDIKISVTKGGKSSELVFPASLKQSEPDEDLFVGVALLNASESTSTVEVSAIDQSGDEQLLRTRVFGPQVQDAFLTRELRDLSKDAVSIRTRDQDGELKGFFLIGDGRPDRLDGVGGKLQASRLLYFPIVARGPEQTVLFLSNPEEEVADMSLALVDAEGTTVSTQNMGLAAGSSRLISIKELFVSATPLTGEHYVTVSAEIPVQGFQLMLSQDAFSSTAAQPVSPARMLLIPHFLLGNAGEDTELRLINPHKQEIQARLSTYDDSANLVDSRNISVPGGGLVVKRLSQTLGTRAIPPGAAFLTGHLSVEILEPADASMTLLGTATFTGTNGKSKSTLPMWRQPRNETLFLHVAQSVAESVFTGLSVMNPAESPASVTVQAFDEKGDKTAEKRLDIQPGRRVVDLLDGNLLFGPEFSQIGGHLLISSDQPVVSFVVFGDGQSRFLAAVEGQ